MIRRSEGKALSFPPFIFFSAFSALASYKEDKGTKEDKHFCLRNLSALPRRGAGVAPLEPLYSAPRISAPTQRQRVGGYFLDFPALLDTCANRGPDYAARIPAGRRAEGPRL